MEGPYSRMPKARIALRAWTLAILGSIAVALLMKVFLPQHAIRGELFEVPELCWPGVAQSDYNQRKCGEFWSGRGVQLAVAGIPLWLTLVAAWWGIDSANQTYRRVRRLLRDEKAVKMAVVSRPAEAWNDYFGWFRCLQSVVVDLPEGGRAKVYLPPYAPIPLPGERIAYVELGRARDGGLRRAGFLYAPHIAIMRGVT